MADRPGFFKDKNGETVIYQHPNLLLLLFLGFSLLHLFVSGGAKEFVGMLGFGFGIAWSYSEVTQGVNGFRKTLGFIVLAYLIGYTFYRNF